MEMPSDCAQLRGPKITRRPGELSVGEYCMLAQMVIWSYTAMVNVDHAWRELTRAGKKL